HDTGGYEPPAIRAGCERFPRFLYLHDSVTILQPGFWKIIDASPPAWLTGPPPMFLAIYNTVDVEPLLPTHELTKADSIHWEGHLPHLLRMPTIWPDVVDATALRREHRHGRDNLVLGNDLFLKWKGTWR